MNSPPCGAADSDRLAARLRALSHPARLKVLATLAGRERCVCGEIVSGLPLAQSTVSQHIKVLLEAGLVHGASDGSRSCYRLDSAAMAALRDDLAALFASLLPASELSSGAGAGLLDEASASPDSM